MADKVEIIPSANRFKLAFEGAWKGAVGGLLSGVGMALVGAPIGTIAGTLVAAAMIGGQDGKTIATIGAFEAAQSIFVGGSAKE